MSAVCALGLDLGTSSAKAVVTDTGGRVLAQASAGYAGDLGGGRLRRERAAHWWSAVTACAREAVARGRPRGRDAAGGDRAVRADARPGAGVRRRAGAAPGPALGRQPRHRVAARLPAPRPGRAGPAGQPAGPRDDRAAADVGGRERAAHVRRGSLGAAAQGLATGPPHRRGPRRAQRRVRQPALRRAGRPLGPRGGQRAGPGRQPAGARCCPRPERRPATSPPRPGPSWGCPRASRSRPGPPTRRRRPSAAASARATSS